MRINRFKELRACICAFSMFVFILSDTVGVYAQAPVVPLQDVKPASDIGQEETAATPQQMPKPGNITVNFKDVDILTVLNYISEVSGMDIIPTPGVAGKVTMRLRDKPWEVALDIVTRNYGYAYSREGNIIRVLPRNLMQSEDTVTEVITLNHIVQEIELVKADGAGNAESSVSVQRKEQGIGQIIKAIEAMLDKGRGERVTYISNANAMVITAIPAKLSSIKNMLIKVDTKPPQILLEAKVVSVVLSDDERLGIDWNAIITASGSARPITAPFDAAGNLNFLDSKWQKKFLPIMQASTDGSTAFPTVSNTVPLNPLTAAQTAGAPFQYGTLDFSDFQAVLRMIRQRGNTEILSTPRVTTLNNQKATIKVIQKIMLQKTQESIQTANVVTVEFETEDNAREVGVKLTVIPHVNEKGDIVVNLIPEVSSNPSFQELTISGAASTVAMSYDTREANTQVRVRDGETIFIGGMIRDEVRKTQNKLPFFGDIFGDVPYLGKAFKYEAEEVDKTEIVFFVTVHLLTDGKESVEKSLSQQQYQDYCVAYSKAVSENKDRDNSIIDGAEKVRDLRTRKMFSAPQDRTIETKSVGDNSSKSNVSQKPWFDFRDTKTDPKKK